MRIPARDSEIPQALAQERVPGEEEGEEVEAGQPGIEGEAVPGHKGGDTSKNGQGQTVAAAGGRRRLGGGCGGVRTGAAVVTS